MQWLGVGQGQGSDIWSSQPSSAIHTCVAWIHYFTSEVQFPRLHCRSQKGT